MFIKLFIVFKLVFALCILSAIQGPTYVVNSGMTVRWALEHQLIWPDYMSFITHFVSFILESQLSAHSSAQLTIIFYVFHKLSSSRLIFRHIMKYNLNSGPALALGMLCRCLGPPNFCTFRGPPIYIIIIIINFYSPVSNTRCHSIGHKMRIARIKIRVDSPGRWERA